MPASSSAEARTRWRKRRREPRKPKPTQDDDILDDAGPEDEEDNNNNNDLDNSNPHPNPNHQEADDDCRNPSYATDRAAQIREAEVVFNHGERISEFPMVIRRQVSRPHSSVLAIVSAESAVLNGESGGQIGAVVENISYGQLQARSAVPLDSPALVGAGSSEEKGEGSYVITPPRIMEGRGVIKRFGSASRVHVMPVHSDWFSPNAVHRLERQVVPHFFSGKSPEHTPEKYMECRNCIVAKYMENPERHLSVADCQGLVTGISLDEMIRIVRFLDQWGIINYCAEAPCSEPRKEGEILFEDSNSELCVPSAALKSIDSLIKFDRPKCRYKATDVYPEIACRSDDESDFDGTIRELLSESRCNHCSRPVAMVHYQSQKEIDVLLCSDCFHQGRFICGHSSLDFVKINSLKEYGDMDGESWTAQETLLLLEGMQLYNENWNEIAEHVGSKSKAQCILHFVRMPVDGALLQNMEVRSTFDLGDHRNTDNCGRSNLHVNGNLLGSSMEDSDCDNKFPFANCGNPVMALVAFLANAMGPRIAAACAHAALAELSKDDGLGTSGSVREMDGYKYENRTNLEGACGKEGFNADEKMGGQSSRSQSDIGVAPLSAKKVRAAARVGLSAAATKAKLFADHEEREIQRLSANIINHQLKRLELKLKQFAEVETYLMRECEGMERTRQRAAAERTLLMTQFGNAVSRSSGLSNVGPAMVGNNSANSRQQVVSGSPQPFFPGYSNNQTGHPPMSIMPQQAMYGLGPRLPLSALHPSSSSANAMFNGAANSQSALSHPMLRPVPGTKSGLG